MDTSSNMTAMLVALPLLAVMAAGFFRLDEYVGRPQKKQRRIPLSGGLDERGIPVGIEPDGTPFYSTKQG